MRLVDWDQPTVAHYRELWDRANKAHEIGLHGKEPKNVASSERQRVRLAIANLLSTNRAVLKPELTLISAVLRHCDSIGYVLSPHRRPTKVNSEARQLPALPEDGFRSVWEKFEVEASKIEATHGRIERLASFLDPLRHDKGEWTEDVLNELWKAAVSLVERELAAEVHPGLIAYFDGEQNRVDSYRHFEIPKRRGGTRTITTPRKNLKTLQRSLLQVLTHLFPRHKCAVGFERGESVVSHAKVHAGKRWVYIVDLQDFFPSITRSRVYGMLRSKPFEASEPLARYLSNLVTYDGVLPQGAPTSPILANLLCRRMDARLFRWARDRGLSYTRYADDLAFSTNRVEFREKDRAEIRKIIEDEGFQVHPEKQKLMPWYGRQFVTGLVVNEKPNVPRSTIRNLRALLHNVEKYGWQSQVNRRQLFNDSEDEKWLAYRHRKLALDQFNRFVKEQDTKKLLIRPGAAIRKAQKPRRGKSPIEMLQSVVGGKIEFLGAVRGGEDSVYISLRNQYDILVDRNRKISEKVDKGGDSFVPDVAIVPDSAKNNEFEFRTLRERIQKNEAEVSELYTWIEKRAEWSLEAILLLDQFDVLLNNKSLILKAGELARSLDTHPAHTASFFGQFKLGRPFRQLLHSPDAGPDEDGRFTVSGGSKVSIPELIGQCERAMETQPLPVPLKKTVRNILDACRGAAEAADKNPVHPFDNPELKEKIRQFKWMMRFGDEKDSDLWDRLKKEIASLQEKGGIIELVGDPTIFYTYTPALTGQKRSQGRRGTASANQESEDKVGAVVRLLRSLVFKAIDKAHKAEGGPVPVQKVSVESSILKTGKFEGVSLVLQAHDGAVRVGKSISNLLHGDTQEVIYDVRGLARWTMTVPHRDGSVHEYDVTNRKHVGESTQQVPGFRHTLFFYR